MNLLTLSAVLILGLGLSQVSAEELDITDRKVTDPLLRITTADQLLPEREDKGFEAKRDEKSNPPLYTRWMGKRDVIMLHPFGEKRPAEMDFSAITSNAKGKLRLAIRNHPAGDFKLEILVNGTMVVEESVGKDNWERFTVPFDHETVVLRDVANDWQCEHAFIEYSIIKE